MDKKLWIIGDSFTTFDTNYWTEILKDKFDGKTYISSKSSRDFQTILDIFLKSLHKISKNDLVILVIPTLSRIRLPLENPTITLHDYETKESIFDYFLGGNGYVKNPNNPEVKLESPLSELDDKFLVGQSENTIWSFTNASNASIKNYIEILKSLKEYLPFEICIWSWCDEMESDFIINKKDIINEIGFWETLNDIWLKENGKDGVRGDVHWSLKTHKAFADYLIVKYPQFFNI